MGGASSDAKYSKAVDIAEDHAAAALALIHRGVPVFPLWWTDGARCGCGKPGCTDQGKHPLGKLVPNGLKDATLDPSVAAQWWALYPDANLGAVTGRRAGVVVVDIDFAAGGDATAADLEAAHAPFPATWAVETGGGGLHLWCAHPGLTVPNSAGKVGPGVDVRGDGGYVVAPPSRHRSGDRYRWAAAWHPDRVPLAELPAWLLALIAPPEMVPIVPAPLYGGVGGNNPAAFPEGERNAALASLGGTMRRRGMGEAAIAAALLAENAERCRPPLDADEVAKIARSVARYAPASTVAVGPRRRGFVEIVGGKAVPR